MAEIKGVVLDIIFRNADNAYTVLLLDTKNGCKTVVGTIPPVTTGEQILVTGEEVFNKRFGYQFEAKLVKISPPSTQENIVKFLSSKLFAGVGKKTAELIVKTFEDETLSIIEYMPERLAQIKGVTFKKALEIGGTFKNNKEMQEIILFLQNYDVTINLAIKIYKKYSKQIYNILNKNPYKMIEDIDGVGFLTADKIALSMNVEKTSDFRIKAGIIYILRENSIQNGNTYMFENELYKELVSLLDFNDDLNEKIENVIKDMEVFGEIKLLNMDNKRIIILSRLFELEKKIAQKLLDLEKNINVFENISIFERKIKEYEKINNIILHENQKQAILEALLSGCTVITGGPGTGKTTIIKGIIYILSHINSNYALAAPTGRASKKMSDTTGEEAKTLHRLLGWGNNSFFLFDEKNKLPYDAIIVDEVSMCDEYIFYALLQSLNYGCKLILIGDADQLPSVGCGNVLHDIIQSNIISTIKLTQIYRQEENSLIVTNAHRINRGEMPLLDNTKKDFFFIQKTEATEIVNEITELCLERLPKFTKLPPTAIQVLCPVKKGLAGVNNINIELQKILNPPIKFGNELVKGDNSFRIGDKIIHTKNNYNLAWIKPLNKGDFEEGLGVFNGDIGFVTGIDKGSMSLTVAFEDGRIAEYTSDILDDIQLAYAISVHKSQGSEFDAVVISIMSGNYMIMTRNLLYTAITRAKNIVVLVGDKMVVEKMVANNFMKKRYTLLTEFLTNKDEILTTDF